MTSFRIRPLLLCFAIAAVLVTFAPREVRAHHAVWVDMSGLQLAAFATVNGNTPPTANDIAAVQALVFANMIEDYAPFDVTLTRFQPANGRYTRVAMLDSAQPGGLYGCAGGSCCPVGGVCTGISSWDSSNPSQAEIYAGSFAGLGSLSGANATTARIANALSHTASHELGHVLDLTHCNAADDSITLGCAGINANTNDQNPNSHIMASGKSWGLTPAQRATVDRFFSIHASRRLLLGNFQVRNHFLPLQTLNGGSRADLLYGRVSSPATTTWYRRLSDGSAFGNWATASTDAGNAGDIFLAGDVSGDGRADLVYGRAVSATQMRWYVRTSNNAGIFSDATVWRDDAGNVGDIFRLGDVNGDGRDDLAYGRPLTSTTVRWYVRLSTGAGFGDYSTWRSDAGDEGDLFFLGDVDGDGDADLVYGEIVAPTQVRWYARMSSGAAFGARETWREDAGDRGDLFYLGPVGDADADLVYGRVDSDTQMRWFVRGSNGSAFGDWSTWAEDAGDAGDLPRLGDGDGDGRLDLVYGRPAGMTSLVNAPDLTLVTWFGRPSQGSAFGDWSTWATDAGNEGDLFP
ncbi:MAG: VCBS repeat-containing protein [Deltaproteobacteria bacterium]|nr:VCBS repeat-containing protein [Deltaproteobacteria bacterium]